ncbi:hypothetical protein V202x_40440 [Gimesia aquarii]|uniref:Uncharacterized protein n=1 Tax=Gimesia aquarii TaxID=2527964 RepID=A0A517WZE8_9PLAN|nr:hypothetical protein V202x_40440 [Gimesia aquarii]
MNHADGSSNIYQLEGKYNLMRLFLNHFCFLLRFGKFKVY